MKEMIVLWVIDLTAIAVYGMLVYMMVRYLWIKRRKATGEPLPKGKRITAIAALILYSLILAAAIIFLAGKLIRHLV